MNLSALLSAISEGGVNSMNSWLILIVSGVLILIGIIPFIIRLVRFLSADLAVTNRRVIGKIGVVSIKSLDYHIDKVDSIKISTTFWGRIFRYYTVEVTGSGEGNNIKFEGISNANQFKNAVNEAIERHAAEARRQQAEQIAMAMSMNKPMTDK